MGLLRSHPDNTERFGGRLNVLLTEGDELWADQLPRLLEPQGVRTLRVVSVDQAVEVIEQVPIHAAVVDLATPMAGDKPQAPRLGGQPAVDGVPQTGGLKLLRVIRGLRPTPPAVVVRGRLFDRRTDDRVLAEALKLDAFSVLDEPVQLEQVLETLRRLLHRYYGGVWPRTD
jgi:DNA-binding response OmpR family regulator